MTVVRAATTEMWPMGTHFWVRDTALIGARFLEGEDPSAVRLGKALLLSAAAADLETQRRWEREAQGRRFREIAGR